MTLSLPASRRALAGARAKRRGARAEDAVERLHASDVFRLRNPGAHLMRRHARTIVVGGVARQVAPQGPDFGGGAPAALWGLGRGGIWVEVEVKAVDPTVAKRLDFARFTDAEVETLSACRASGGVAIVLVLYGTWGIGGTAPDRGLRPRTPVVVARWCAVPWERLESRVRHWAAITTRDAGVPASISESELLGYAVQPLDYLRAGGSR